MRGGTHIVAYAKALEALSGVDVGKLLPMPDISNKRFPEAPKHEAKGLHQVKCRMSPDDYRSISKIWAGPHPEDGSELRVVDGPPEGGPVLLAQPFYGSAQRDRDRQRPAPNAWARTTASMAIAMRVTDQSTVT